LGVWLAFRRLRAAGLVTNLPRLVAVQPTKLSPLCLAFDAGLDNVPAMEPTTPSVAEGLAIAEPVRGRRLLQALRETDGTCVTVDDDAILDAQRQLAQKGLFVEPTSATVVAALGTVIQQASADDTIVVPLTGSGLKGSPRLER
jgi:threonine synthase